MRISKLTCTSRNAMQVEFAKDLMPTLRDEGSDLQIQAKFMSEREVLDAYLKRGFGNAYDFDQGDKIEGVF